jgi:hypothetical protein
MRLFAGIIMPHFLSKLNLYLRLRSRSFGFRLMRVPDPEKWVFIVGCYNSGTTLLHSLLAQHDSVGSMPNEGQFFTSQLMTGEKAGVRRLWALKPELFRLNEKDEYDIDPVKLKREWAFFYNDPEKPVLIEKTIANAARTRWLQKNFAPAYFICLFRNGYAVAEGIHRKEKHPVETAIRQWKTSNDILMEDMQHLKNVLSISYEALADDPAGTMNKVTGFLELNPLPAKVFDQEFSVHEMKSSIRNMNADAIKRLTADQIRIINSIAENSLRKSGYEIL